MAAPVDNIRSLLDEIDAYGQDPNALSSGPTIEDRLRDAATLNPTQYNHANKTAPLNESPRFLAESPEFEADQKLKAQAALVEERPKLRRAFDESSDLPIAIGPERIRGVARAHDSLQQLPDPKTVRPDGASGFFDPVFATSRAAVDQFQGTLFQHRIGAYASLEISDALAGTEFGGARNRDRIRNDLRSLAENQATLEEAPFLGQMFAVGFGQVPHLGMGFFGRFAGRGVGALAGAPFGPQAMAAGGVAGTLIGGFTPMATLEGGLFYADAMDSMPDVPNEDKAAMAVVVGMVNGALELVPLESAVSTLTNKFRRDAGKLLADQTFRDYGMYALRRIVTQAIAEGGTEFLQEIPGTLVPALRQYANGEIEFSAVVESIISSEFGKRALKSAQMGAMGAPVVAGVSLGIGAVGFQGRVEEAQANREVFQKIADIAVDNSEIIQEMPERYHQLMEDALDEDGQIEGVYVAPDRLLQAYEGDGAAELSTLQERIPGLRERISLAAETGGKVRFSPAEFATFVAPSARFAKIGDDLSFGEDQSSLREAFEMAKPETVERVRAQLSLLQDAMDVDIERDADLERDFVSNMSAIFAETLPAVAAPVREKNAELLGRIVMRIAEMDGSDPLETMTNLLDRVQFEQRRELDSPAEIARSEQALRAGGQVERLGQFAVRSVEFGDAVSGLRVRDEIPNTSSIGASLANYEEVGLQEIPLSAFEVTSPSELFYARDDLQRVDELAAQIQDSGEINPLIVVEDAQGMYVLEGGHRLAALSALGVESLPALVVRDLDSLGQADVFRQQVGVAAPEEVRAAATQALANNAMNLTEAELGQTALSLFTSPKYEGKRKVDEVAKEFEAAAQLKLDDYTPENVQMMGRLIATEVLRELRDNPETAIEWYAERIQNMQKVMALIHPEIADDPLAKAALNIGLAITSQGTAVPTNLDMAEQAYEHFQKHGKFPIIGTGQQTQSQKSNFELVNELIDEHGFDAVVSLFDQYGTQSQFDQITGKAGADAKTSIVPGSVLLGPKIGRFYQNLNGNFDELTVDLWFMRMWGRLTGRLIKVTADELKVKHREELKAAAEGGVLAQIGVEDVDLAQLDFDGLSKLATRVHRIDTKQGFRRDNSDSVNALYKAAKTITTEEGVIDAPESGTQRQYHREAVAAALEQLSAVGINMTPAALQATVWYPEKALYAHLGAGNARSAPTDFEAEARRLAEERGHDLDEIESVVRGDDGGRRPGAAEAGEDAGKRRGRSFHLTLIEQLTGLQPVPAGSGRPRAFGGRGTKTGVGQRFSPTNEGKAALEQLDVPAPTFEQVGAKKFFAAITAAKTAHQFGSSVELKSLEEYEQPGMRLFLAETVETTPNPKAKSGVSKKKRWLSGFAITADGDIVSAFNHPEAESDRVPAMLLLAIQEGGYKLDAFDTVLPGLYSRMGFVPTARVAFDDDEAPPDWDRELYSRFNDGRPDIVFMRLDPLNAHDYVTGEGPMMEYGQAVQSNSTPVAQAVAGAAGRADAEAVDQTQAAVDAFNQGKINVFRQAAYHGSGARFNRFSTDFMGTGEGAQAFGWGLYFSSSRGIAEHYRKALSKRGQASLRPEDFTFPENFGTQLRVALMTAANDFFDYRNPKSDIDRSAVIAKAIDRAGRQIAGLEQESPYFRSDEDVLQDQEAIAKLRQSIAELETIDPESFQIRKPTEKTGQVFKVDIPDDSELANWDEPMAEQPEAVRQFFGFDPDRVNANLQEVRDAIELIVDNDEPLYENRDEILNELDRYVADPNNPETRQFLADVLSGYQDLIFNESASNYLEQLEIEHTTDDFEEAYRAKVQELGSDRAVSEALAAAGIKGHKYAAGQLSGGAGAGATNYVIYDDAAIQIAETYYSQSLEAKPVTRGQLVVDRQIQKMLLQLSEENVNESTLTHELFHLALELVLDASESPAAGPEIRQYRKQIFEFLGVETRDQIGREQHERWAESGEVYMASGEAPTAELRGLFRFFFQRFKQVYRAIREQLRFADPNNDFVPLFDRLLASEDEIRREANRDHVVVPMLAPELTQLLNRGEEEELRRRLAELNRSERAKLEATIAREDERIIKAQMGELKQQVRQEVYGRRVHKLALWLRTGRTEVGEPLRVFVAGSPVDDHKMNAELLDEAAGDVATRKALRGMSKREGGLSPDAVAAAAGYSTAEEMLVELLAMENSEQLISRMVQERAAALGLVKTPEQLREAASKKVDGQARDRLYAAQRRIAKRLRGQMPALDRVERARLRGEAAPTVADAQQRLADAQTALDQAMAEGVDPAGIEALQADVAAAQAGIDAAREARADQTQARREAKQARSKMPVQAIRAAAREIIGKTKFGDLKREVGRYKKLRSKASMTQTEAALNRDWDALEEAIDQEQMANALAEEGAKKLEEVRKWKRLIESFDKPKSRKRARLSKHANYEDQDGTTTNVMDVIDGLLGMVSFKNVSLRKLEQSASIALFAKKVEDSNGIVLPLPPWVEDLIDRPNYKSMAVSDLEDLYIGVKALEKFGMDIVAEKEGAEAAEDKAEIDEMRASLDEQKPVFWAGKTKLGESQRSKTAKFFGSAIGSQMSFESIADILDDLNPEGAFNRFFVQRFKAAAFEEQRLRKMVSERINKVWQKYTPAEQRNFYSKPIPISTLGESLTKNEILAIAANMGNPHNRAALQDARAYGLSDAQLEEILSHVTDKDADYLEAVIAAVDLLWEPAAAAEREANGVTPPKVEAVPWQLPSGRIMKGGYWPLMFDPALAERSAEFQAQEIGKGLMPAGGGAAMTKVGAMKARKKTSGKLTVRTDFHAVLQKHVNAMSKDIAWRNTIVKADKQLRKLAPELKRVLGDQFYRHMRDYLKRQGTPLRNGDQGVPDYILKVARRSRHGLGLTVMAYRLTQAAIQVSGFATAVPRVGVSNMLWALGDVGATVWNWDRIKAYRELIPELANRAETFDRDAQQDMLRLQPLDVRRPIKSIDTIQAFSAHVGYSLMGMIDTFSSTVVASAAMHQAMSGQVDGISANDLEAAVRYAGKIIDRTQGSGGSVNAPAMLDGGEMMKLLTPMMTYVNAQTQQAFVYAALGKRQFGDPTAPYSIVPGVPREAARLATFYLWVYVIETVLSEGLRYILNGAMGPDEPDEEAFFDVLAARAAMGPFAGMPVFREIDTLARGWRPSTPMSSLLQTSYNALAKPIMDVSAGKDYDGEKHVRAIATALSTFTGLPGKQLLDGVEVLTQESFGRGR